MMVCMGHLALTGSTGAPNISALYQTSRRHSDQMKNFFSLFCKGVAYTISYPTFNVDDKIQAGGGKHGMYSA